MKKNNFFKLTFIAALLYAGIDAQAQVKVGDNPTTSNANSVLEMESTNKGMLLPRVDLTATTAAAPLAAHVAGMTVYNKATAGDVTPGYYYNDGTKWVRLMNAADATALEPWFNVATGAGATANTQNIYQMGNVGIGTNNPTFPLSIHREVGSSNVIEMRGITNGTYLLGQRGEGSLAAPAAIGGDRTLLSLGGGGYDGTTWIHEKGTMEIRNPQTWTSTSTPTYIRFKTTNIGSTSLTEHMRITETGNVGIGTTTPSNKLHVTATADPLKLEGLQAGAGTDEVLTTDAAGVVRKLTGAALATAVQEPWYNVATNAGATANTQDIYQMGKVGIGTTAPQFNLDVTNSASNGVIKINSATGFSSQLRFHENQALKWKIENNTAAGTVGLSFYNNNTGSSNMFIEESTGNVGIGTATPTQKLEVVGRIQSVTQQVVGSGYGAYMEGSNAQQAGVVEGFNWGTGTAHLLFNRNGGNVGIGMGMTAMPTEKLHVIGNILASGTITPDYVFEEYVNGVSTLKPEYKRMSLQEVDAFVKENKHLPGVPSAKEVQEKGGIVVNRATEINLEKIEELYLHVIEQQKQIDALKAELSALKK